MKNLGLIPIRNFGVVHEGKGIYRSAQPLYSYEYAWLKRQGITLIVNLRSESDHDSKMSKRYGIKVVNFRVHDHKEPTDQQANKFMELIRNNKNILFHCEHGHGRTSTFCVLARLALGWSLDRALDEEKKKFHYQFKHHIQETFLKKFYEHYVTGHSKNLSR